MNSSEERFLDEIELKALRREISPQGIVIIPYNSAVIDKPSVELIIRLPDKCVITLISRNEEYIVPTGVTRLQGGDVLLIILNKASVPEAHRILSAAEARVDALVTAYSQKKPMETRAKKLLLSGRTIAIGVRLAGERLHVRG